MSHATQRKARVTTKRSESSPPQERLRVARSKAVPLLAVAALCALVLGAYGNSIRNGFVWDDNQQIVMNPQLRPGAPLLRLFSGDVWSFTQSNAGGKINYYRPLQMLTYRLTAAVWGFNATAFHMVSIGFHLVVAVLTLALFWRLCGRMDLAFASAALFAVHPAHSEAVDWISALPDLGCTAFLLLAMLLFLYGSGTDISTARAQSRESRMFFIALSCAAFAAALLWKETAIVFPLLIIAYALLCLDANQIFSTRLRNALKLSLPYWCLLTTYLLLRLRILGFLVTSQRSWALTTFQFGLTVLNLLLGYCVKLIAPFHLSAYYVFSPVRSIGDVRALTSVLFLGAVAITMVYSARRAPLATYAALWVFLTLIPVLNVYAVGRNVFTERYLYLPSVGFCLLLVLAASWVGRQIPERFRSTSAALVLIGIVALCAEQTIARNPDWKDGSTLFTRTLELSPNAPFVHNMVAEVQRTDENKPDSAENNYLQAIDLAEKESPPDRLQIALAYEGLASIFASHSEFDRAVTMLDHARIANPEDPEVDGEQGLILVQAGRWAEAERALQRAVAVSPNNENVLNALGLISWQHSRKLDAATAYFMRALTVHIAADDFSASLHNNLAAIYGEENRLSDAIAQLKIAVGIAPNDPEYRTNLAQAYVYVGESELARRELQTALALAPDYQPARAALQRLSGQ